MPEKKTLIGTTQGSMFGVITGMLVEEFGLEEVESAFTHIMGGIRAVLGDAAAAARVDAANDQYREQLAGAVISAVTKVSS